MAILIIYEPARPGGDLIEIGSLVLPRFHSRCNPLPCPIVPRDHVTDGPNVVDERHALFNDQRCLSFPCFIASQFASCSGCNTSPAPRALGFLWLRNWMEEVNPTGD